jgi:DNA mismatch repair ATPase MutS
MNTKLLEHYSDLIANYQIVLDNLIKKGRLISLFRGLIFLGLVLFMVFVWKYDASYIVSVIGLSIVPFLILIKLNVSTNLKIRHFKELIKINRNEISGLKGDHSVFPTGKEFIDPNHPYSYDLDIFGEGSIFQLLDRSCTMGGSALLADILKSCDINIPSITEKQKAIGEMANLLDWRQNFNATGKIALETDEQINTGIFQLNNQINSVESKFHDEMINWLQSPFYFIGKKLLKYTLLVMPAISIVLFVLMLAGIIPILGFILYGLFQLGIIGFNLKNINRIHLQIGRKAQILKKYGSLLNLIEKQNFNSSYLQKLKNISGINDRTASNKLKHLQSLANSLDNRLNILISIVANAYLLWDLQIVSRIESWRKSNAQLMIKWFEVIYKFDAFSGFASFAFNNPSYCFPEIVEGDFEIEIQQAGHPLINSDVRINNDLKIEGHKQLLVLTGANMAGKSTFLRTIGVNMVLAMSGSVVCAQKLRFSPIALHTSIKTSDSVQKNESYFYAELKRLKMIIDRMQKGEKLFVIIDEMLRGTNSKDKHMGSQALIEQLIRLDGSGLLATHDIALGELAEKYPKNVKNYRFEVEIKDDELVFDYKLKDGISKNLNATFLMKKMGITL